MPKQIIFSEVWTEVVQVLDGKMALDSKSGTYLYQAREKPDPGFYLSLRRMVGDSLQEDSGNCHLVGPFEHKSAVDLLRASVLYFGASDRQRMVRARMRRVNAISFPPSLLPNENVGMLCADV